MRDPTNALFRSVPVEEKRSRAELYGLVGLPATLPAPLSSISSLNLPDDPTPSIRVQTTSDSPAAVILNGAQVVKDGATVQPQCTGSSFPKDSQDRKVFYVDDNDAAQTRFMSLFPDVGVDVHRFTPGKEMDVDFHVVNEISEYAPYSIYTKSDPKSCVSITPDLTLQSVMPATILQRIASQTAQSIHNNYLRLSVLQSGVLNAAVRDALGGETINGNIASLTRLNVPYTLIMATDLFVPIVRVLWDVDVSACADIMAGTGAVLPDGRLPHDSLSRAGAETAFL